jgi:hypothetical protein
MNQENLHQEIYLIGLIFSGCATALCMTGLLYLSGMYLNKALWYLVESLGGIKVFNEFREFVRNKKE